jgi:hypothetical protein
MPNTTVELFIVSVPTHWSLTVLSTGKNIKHSLISFAITAAGL